MFKKSIFISLILGLASSYAAASSSYTEEEKSEFLQAINRPVSFQEREQQIKSIAAPAGQSAQEIMYKTQEISKLICRLTRENNSVLEKNNGKKTTGTIVNEITSQIISGNYLIERNKNLMNIYSHLLSTADQFLSLCFLINSQQNKSSPLNQQTLSDFSASFRITLERLHSEVISSWGSKELLQKYLAKNFNKLHKLETKAMHSAPTSDDSLAKKLRLLAHNHARYGSYLRILEHADSIQQLISDLNSCIFK
ncbi:MAG: hypothetical protein KBB83_01825 [Alphaproteobacteria bacterium]|nr:hypothetical protein [Alphaproteobacteria bacterium]